MPPHDPLPQGARRPRRLARLGLAALSLAMALGLAEAVTRLRAEAPHDAGTARASLWAIVEGMGADLSEGRVTIRGSLGDSSVMLHPYLGFDAASGLEQVERDLARAREPGAERDFDVYVLGGSVAALVAFEAQEPLVAALAADPRLAGREVRVHVYARGAFKQPQQVLQLAWLFGLGLEPDAVLHIDGYNELSVNANGFARGVHPAQPQLPYWGTVLASAGGQEAGAAALRERAVALDARGRTWCARFDHLGLEHSALATWAMDALLRRQRERLVALQDAYANRLQRIAIEQETAASRALRGPRRPDGEAALDACVRGWREGSRMLRALCEARGVPYVHLLQPTLHDAGSKPLTDEERAHGGLAQSAIDAVRAGYPLLREAGRALADEGEVFVDASLAFAELEQTLYYDACHFEAPGTDLLAAAAAEALLAALP